MTDSVHITSPKEGRDGWFQIRFHLIFRCIDATIGMETCTRRSSNSRSYGKRLTKSIEGAASPIRNAGNPTGTGSGPAQKARTKMRSGNSSWKSQFLATLLLATVAHSALVDTKVTIDWPAFLSRHDPVWESLPTYAYKPYTEATSKLDSSAFLGNGLLGVLVHREGPNTMVWNLGRSDVFDHRPGGSGWFGNNRLPIGDFFLKTVGTITSGEMRVNLYNAELFGTVKTTSGTIQFRTLVVRDREILLIELRPSAGEKTASWSFKPDTSITSRPLDKAPTTYSGPNPAGWSTKKDSTNIFIQPMSAGGEYATAWRSIASGDTLRTLLANTSYSRTKQVRDSAATKVSSAASTGSQALRYTHQTAWHKLYARHFLSIPDTRMETYYWLQIYKLLSAGMENGPAINLQGPWSVSTGWPCYWWDMNMELLYLPMNPANLTEISRTLTNMFDRKAAQLQVNVKNCTESAGLGVTSGDELTAGASASTDQLPWNLHTYYMLYRHTMDDAMLRNRLYPLLRSNMNTYLGYLNLESDGKYHMAISASPDYEVPLEYRLDPANDRAMKDANYKLALIRWEAKTLLDVTKRLSIVDPLAKRWQGILDSLVAFQIDTNGMMIGSGVPLTLSHRHYSHLIALFHLHVLSWDNPKDTALIRKSVTYWASLTNKWHAYAYTGAASFFATMRDGNQANTMLTKYLDHGADLIRRPSTMYQEGNNPVMETPFGWTRSLQDMMLQSWGGAIRVFPAIPSTWSNANFHTMRAEGAFLVSGIRKGGTTSLIRIQSLAGEPCRIKTDMKRPISISANRTLSARDSSDGFYYLDLQKGETAVLHPSTESPTQTISAIPYQQGSCNFYGGQHKGHNYTFFAEQNKVALPPTSSVASIQTRTIAIRSHQSALQITTPQGASHHLEFYGPDGSRKLDLRGIGESKYMLDRSKLPRGVYLLRSRLDSEESHRTILIQ